MADLRPLAWNGLAMRLPEDWELKGLGARHLVLARGREVVMEAKWNRVTGRFDLDRHLKKLAKSLGGLTPVTPPTAWKSALARFETRVFDLSHGRGVLLSCPECRTASLLRFAGAGAAEAATPALILESLACHFADGFTPWRVFGFAARTPSTYALTSHRLTPGRYELTLEAGSNKLIVASLGPADVLLAGKDLAAWCRATFDETISRHRLQPVAGETPNEPALAWRAEHEPRLGRRLFLRLRREPTRGGLMVRHDTAANRLYCLEASARRPLDWKLLVETEAGLGAVR